jgi:anti-anti-sigma factor
MADEGKVLYARHDGTCVLRFQGAIRYTMAHGLDVFLDRLFAQDDPCTICADLNAAESIDSTGIGLLAKIAICQKRCGRGKPVLFSANREINELLTNVCLDEVFVMVEGKADDEAGEPLPPAEATQDDVARTIYEAHRLLSDLSEGNRAMFKDVVDALGRELSQGARRSH